MLVLSRRVNEAIIIGDDLVVEVVAVAPTDVTIRLSRLILSGLITKEIDTRTLKSGERTALDHESAIELVDLKEDKARLGVSAPRTTSVHRFEVWEAIKLIKRM